MSTNSLFTMFDIITVPSLKTLEKWHNNKIKTNENFSTNLKFIES